MGYEGRYFTYMRKRRKQNALETATFPGYLFIRLIPDTPDWAVIANLSGAIRFLGDDGYPKPLPPGEFGRILKAHDEEFDEPVSATKVREVVKRLFKGMRGTIVDGPFASFEVEVHADENDGNVKVDAVFFGRSTTMIMKSTNVKVLA